MARKRKIVLFPGLHAMLEDVSIRNRGADVASAKETSLGIALRGSLDFANERFDDVSVAVVDGKGCAKMRQRIRGPFRKPVAEKVSVLQSVTGPVLKLFKQAKEFFGGRCEVFYAGSVAPPE